jgi:phage gp36-like protein
MSATAYINIADLLRGAPPDALLECVDDARTRDIGNAEVVAALEAECEASSREIDGYLETRYPSLPLSPVPGLVKVLCRRIAIYNLFARRGFKDESADKVVIDNYQNAIKQLEAIQQGKLALGPAVEEPPVAAQPAPPASRVSIGSSPRAFTRETTRGM